MSEQRRRFADLYSRWCEDLQEIITNYDRTIRWNEEMIAKYGDQNPVYAENRAKAMERRAKAQNDLEHFVLKRAKLLAS